MLAVVIPEYRASEISGTQGGKFMFWGA